MRPIMNVRNLLERNGLLKCEQGWKWVRPQYLLKFCWETWRLNHFHNSRRSWNNILVYNLAGTYQTYQVFWSIIRFFEWNWWKFLQICCLRLWYLKFWTEVWKTMKWLMPFTIEVQMKSHVWNWHPLGPFE